MRKPAFCRLPSVGDLHTLCLRTSAIVFALPCAGAAAASAANGDARTVAWVEFDNDFLPRSSGGRPLDLSRFTRGNPVLPGRHRVDLSINQQPLGRAVVHFRATSDSVSAQPCFGRSLLERIGVDFGKLTADQLQHIDAQKPEVCVALADLIPDASASFDSSERRLDVSIPQASLLQRARGYVDPSLWNKGITAGMLSYNFSGTQYRAAGSTNSNAWLGLHGGFNIGGWNFRHDGSLNTSNRDGTRYQSIATYVRYAIPAWHSQLTVGEGFTSQSVFDSFGYTGISITSDDRMQPDSQRGFAPVIRGVASSTARIMVRQNGNLLYETVVPPGPFEIDDIYPTGFGGDLDVTVRETDGVERTFKVPYASVPELLRQGAIRYGVTAGTYREPSLRVNSPILTASVRYGLNNAVTGYGGVLFASSYASVLLGTAWNTVLGAFSADFAHAHTYLPHARETRGQSYQLKYAKTLPATGTSVSMAALRYSTRGYLTLADAMRALAYAPHGSGLDYTGPTKNSLQMNLSQNLGAPWGSIYLTGQSNGYWNRNNRDTTFQLGYSNQFRQLFYSASVSRSRLTFTDKWDNRLYLSLTVPLGQGGNAPSMTTIFTRDDTGYTSAQAMLTGTDGPHSEFSYNLSGGRDRSPAGVQGVGNAGASYTGSYGTLNANVGITGSNRQLSLGAAGGLIVHAGGVTLGPPLGDTVALVEAEGAAGAYLNGNANSRIGRGGYAIVPSLVPYSSNSVLLEPKGLPLDVELDSTSEHVTPYAESVVLIKFASQRRRTVQLKVRMLDGKPVPFGAEVSNSKGRHVGYVSQAGRILARGVEEIDVLTVSWGHEGSARCEVRIDSKVGTSDYSPCRPVRVLRMPNLEAGIVAPGESIAANATEAGTEKWTNERSATK